MRRLTTCTCTTRINKGTRSWVSINTRPGGGTLVAFTWFKSKKIPLAGSLAFMLLSSPPPPRPSSWGASCTSSSSPSAHCPSAETAQSLTRPSPRWRIHNVIIKIMMITFPPVEHIVSSFAHAAQACLSHGFLALVERMIRGAEYVGAWEPGSQTLSFLADTFLGTKVNFNCWNIALFSLS